MSGVTLTFYILWLRLPFLVMVELCVMFCQGGCRERELLLLLSVLSLSVEFVGFSA